MPDYVTLLGAEDVRRAGAMMQQAADDMKRASASIEHSLRQFGDRMEDHVQRLEALAEDKADG